MTDGLVNATREDENSVFIVIQSPPAPVILAAAGIQSPGCRPTWLGNEVLARPPSTRRVGAAMTVLADAKGSGFPRRRE